MSTPQREQWTCPAGDGIVGSERVLVDTGPETEEGWHPVCWDSRPPEQPTASTGSPRAARR